MRRWRYRPVQTAVVAVLALLITACAGFAPLYYRAMQQSLVAVGLGSAPTTSTGLQLSSFPSNGYDPSPAQPPELVAEALPASYRDVFEPVVLGYTASSKVLPSGAPSNDLIWRSDVCSHLTFTAGRCPRAADEIAVSRADVRNFGYSVGTVVKVLGESTNTLHAHDRVVRLRVVGVYQQTPGDYWFGLSLTGWSGKMSAGMPSVLQHDVWVTDRSTIDGPDGAVVTVFSSADYVLDRDRVGVDELLGLGREVERLHEPESSSSELRVASGLPALADDVDRQIDQARTTVPLLVGQLWLLVLVVLWLVLLAVTEQRRPEAALARLHGRGPRGARRLLLVELVPIVLLAVLPGAALALVAAAAARGAVLPGSPTIEPGWAFLAAVLGAAVALVAVTYVAAARIAREPVERLLRQVPARRTGWRPSVGEAMAMAGAGGVVVVFATGGLDGPVALVAPGLLAVLVGLILGHLITPTMALIGRRQLGRGRVRLGVSLLDAARRPATGRVVAMVTLAAALAVFAGDALAVGDRNRALAAEQEAGAVRVADVVGADLSGLQAALAEVDPGGEQVTPVVEIVPGNQAAPPTLAVVPDSFRQVALFPGGAPDPALWKRLAPPTADPLEVTGTGLAVRLDSTLRSRQSDGTATPVSVGLDLADQAGRRAHVTLDRLGAGSPAGIVRRSIHCADGCTVLGLTFGTVPGATIRGTLTLSGLTAEPAGDAVPIGPADQWRALADADRNAIVPSSSSADELSLEITGTGASNITLDHAWVPEVVPALVAGALPPDSDHGRFTLAGLDGQSQDAEEVGSVARIPGAPRDAFLVDLDLLQRGRTATSSAHLEVWFADADPALLARVSDALAERGIDIGSDRTLSDVRRTYDQTAAAWSLRLAVVVGLAALLIGACVLVVSAVAGWRERARDLAALRMAGIPTSATRSMAVAAQLPAVVVGVLAGAGCGLAGAVLALPIVPLFAQPPEVSTLDLATSWPAVAVALLAAAVVLGLTSLLLGRALAARAELSRLRETL